MRISLVLILLFSFSLCTVNSHAWDWPWAKPKVNQSRVDDAERLVDEFISNFSKLGELDKMKESSGIANKILSFEKITYVASIRMLDRKYRFNKNAVAYLAQQLQTRWESYADAELSGAANNTNRYTYTGTLIGVAGSVLLKKSPEKVVKYMQAVRYFLPVIGSKLGYEMGLSINSEKVKPAPAVIMDFGGEVTAGADNVKQKLGKKANQEITKLALAAGISLTATRVFMGLKIIQTAKWISTPLKANILSLVISTAIFFVVEEVAEAYYEDKEKHEIFNEWTTAMNKASQLCCVGRVVARNILEDVVRTTIALCQKVIAPKLVKAGADFMKRTENYNKMYLPTIAAIDWKYRDTPLFSDMDENMRQEFISKIKSGKPYKYTYKERKQAILWAEKGGLYNDPIMKKFDEAWSGNKLLFSALSMLCGDNRGDQFGVARLLRYDKSDALDIQKRYREFYKKRMIDLEVDYKKTMSKLAKKYIDDIYYVLHLNNKLTYNHKLKLMDEFYDRKFKPNVSRMVMQVMATIELAKGGNPNFETHRVIDSYVRKLEMLLMANRLSTQYN